MVPSRSEFNWRRTATAVLVLALFLFGAAAFPVVKESIAEREAERVASLYANGLSPCVAYFSAEADAFLGRFLSGKPSVSITAWPAFSEASAIRLVEEDLYYFVLDVPFRESQFDLPYDLDSTGIPTTFKSRVSSEIALKLPQVLAADISNATAVQPFAVDGTSYYFSTAEGKCATTDQSEPGTRAGKYVELFTMLAQLARTGAAPQQKEEREILSIIESLKIE